MLSITERRRNHEAAGAMADNLNIRFAATDRIFGLKDGGLAVVLALSPADCEGRDPSWLESMTLTWQRAAKVIDENHTLYTIMTRRRGANIATEKTAGCLAARKATQSRHAFLASRSDAIFHDQNYAVIMAHSRFRPSRGFAAMRELAALLAPVEIPRRVDHALTEACEGLISKASTFQHLIDDAFATELLSVKEGFQLFRQLLNFKPEKLLCHMQSDEALDHQACGSSLECHPNHLVLDDHPMQVLTLKQPPAFTSANMLAPALALRANMTLVTEWRPKTREAALARIRSQRRHFKANERSLVSSALASEKGQHDLLKDDSAAARVDELGHCMTEIETQGGVYGEFSLTVVISECDHKTLRASVSAVTRAFSGLGMELLEERYNSPNAFFATIPGNSILNYRRLWLTAVNYADLSPIFAPATGEPFNRHLQESYLAVLENASGQPYYFNMHVGDVAHSLVVGATGSGKSFFLNFLITSAQKYEPRVVIFDLGGSYRMLTPLMGGQYVKFSDIALQDGGVKINPFAQPLTPQHHQFLLSFVTVLIEQGGYTLTSPEAKDLFAQIENLYEVEPAERRLSTLGNMLPRPLREALGKWTSGGPYAAVFDNAVDSFTLASFQTIDFEGMDKHPQVLEPLLFYLFHRAAEMVGDATFATTFKLLILDEAWRFFNHPAIRSYIIEQLKTARKKNAAVILATQSTDDLLKSEMLDTIAENCPTKIFLANPGMNKDLYAKAFGLSATEAALIAELQPKSELLLKRAGSAHRLRLDVDPASYWLFTSNPYDNERRERVFAEHGPERGLEILAKEKP